jgi:Na+/citrate or Na+/malate symporter
MTVACYIIGQRYYTVPYNVKKIIGYLIFTLTLYATGDIIRLFIFNPGTIAWFLSMALLIGIFALVVLKIEKPNLKISNVRSQDHK